MCEEKAQLLAYENNIKPKSRDANIQPPTSLPPFTPQTTTSTVYPLTPNICVEGGRIEFIKTSPDVENCIITTPSSYLKQNVETPSIPPPPPPRYSATSVYHSSSSHQSIASSQRHSAVLADIKPEVVSQGQQTVECCDKYGDEKVGG